MRYIKALPIAEAWKRRLSPFCERIEIAGSIRRQKSEVKDIEIVCIPKTVPDVQIGLFAAADPRRNLRHPGFASEFYNASENELMIEMGKPDHGKYVKIMLIEHQIKIDLFIATAENFGFLLAIRTGPADYSHRILGNTWSRMGYHG